MDEAIHVQMDLQNEVNYVQKISQFPLRVQSVGRELVVEISSVLEASQILGYEQMALICFCPFLWLHLLSCCAVMDQYVMQPIKVFIITDQCYPLSLNFHIFSELVEVSKGLNVLRFAQESLPVAMLTLLVSLSSIACLSVFPILVMY